MNLRACFIVSLGLNVILAGVIGWGLLRPDSTLRGSVPGPQLRPQPTPIVAVGPDREIQTNFITATFDWSEVESADYREYRDRLRALGCPEIRIRDIIVADVNALFASRARDYVAPLQAQFWTLASQTRDLEDALEPHSKALEALATEREQIFEELFGTSNPRQEAHATARETRRRQNDEGMLDFLDETKRAGIMALQADFAATNAAIRSATYTGDGTEARRQRGERLRLAREEQDARLQALLDPAELAEYRLRNSNGARVRHQLGNMTVTEAEVRAMARALAAQDATPPSPAQTGPARNAARDQLQQTAQAEIKELLGTERYQEYQLATDHRYTQTARLTERLQLPEAVAVSLYQTQVETEKLARQIRTDGKSTPPEREAALNLLHAEAGQAIRTLIGPDAYLDYQYHAGHWMEKLRPARD